MMKSVRPVNTMEDNAGAGNASGETAKKRLSLSIDRLDASQTATSNDLHGT